MNMIRTPLRLAGLAAILATSAPALAQDGDDDGWVVTIGPGAYFAPKFPGSDELKLRPWPVIDLRRANTPPRYESPDQSFGFSLVGGDFRFGPAVQLQYGRRTNDVPGLGKVGRTVEVGGFAEAYLSENFRLRGEVRKGLGGHKGVVGDIGADLISGSPAQTVFSIGPRVKLVNDRYNREFFGVDATQAVASGLGVYDADGGVHSAGALAFASHQFDRSWGIQGYARYDRLLGDAEDSPLVRSAFGSRNQYEVGIGLSYSFNVG